MAKASRAEVARRIEDIVPLVIDGFFFREIRAWTLANTPWGSQISEVQLKRYAARAKIVMRAAAKIDLAYEVAAAKLRNERAITRSATKGDVRTYAAVNRQQCELLGLNAAIRLEYSDETDIVAVRKKLEDEVAEALAEEEGETDGAS
jgi:hypothetical protein